MPEKWVVSANTPACMVCGQRSVVEVDAAGHKAWKEGALIQVALPELTADERELLKTGTHAACWDVFAGEED